MADKAKIRQEIRTTRKKGLRKKVKGTAEKPRLCVYRSLKYTYAQLISDEKGIVLGMASTKQLANTKLSAKCVDSAKALGKKIAEIAKAKNIETVVFDRNGYLYHGRVAAVADGAREGGLNF
ncbi:MAG: 50S ribosomal protein L18 [Deltaproteobacteria bacterium]|jgi:large subunit ribosomal protein L18|nr:50S ribosomal protein L18 [Deltaproteobacteria bacterium]